MHFISSVNFFFLLFSLLLIHIMIALIISHSIMLEINSKKYYEEIKREREISRKRTRKSRQERMLEKKKKKKWKNVYLLFVYKSAWKRQQKRDAPKKGSDDIINLTDLLTPRHSLPLFWHIHILKCRLKSIVALKVHFIIFYATATNGKRVV